MNELARHQSLVGADRRAKRHDAGRACVHQIARDVQVGVHVRHDNKPLFCEDFGCADGFLIVRQQIFAVAHDLDFDKVAAADLARQACNAHRFVRVARARGVGQQGDALRDVIEDVRGAALVGAAQRERDDLRACIMYGRID